MPYLIDGHNLIAQMPGMALTDPDDEAKLVLKLRSFAGRVGKRVTVVFDHGLPGGVSTLLSTHSVQVRFAFEHGSADQVLRDIIRRLDNPSGWILVSSDVEVTALAQLRGMKCVASQVFAHQLSELPAAAPKSRAARRAKGQKENPRLSQAELDEWLSLFGDKAEL
jgi:hypothetical protein